MDKRRLLLALPILAALLAGSLGYLLAGTQQGQNSSQTEHAMRVEVAIYKNGELVYYDPDDPALRNFVRYVAGLFKVNPPDLTMVDGSTRDPDYVWYGSSGSNYVHGGPAYVAVSNDTVAFTRSLTTFSFMVKVKVDDTAIQVGDNYIQISGSINIPSQMNITYVALLAQEYEGDNKLVLLFADPLDQPISVQAGDVVTVVYKIVFP